MENETDWARVNAMTREEVEPLPEGWERTIIPGVPEPKKDVLPGFVRAREQEERSGRQTGIHTGPRRDGIG